MEEPIQTQMIKESPFIPLPEWIVESVSLKDTRKDHPIATQNPKQFQIFFRKLANLSEKLPGVQEGN